MSQDRGPSGTAKDVKTITECASAMRRTMRVTFSARYEAARRLRGESRLSTYAIAALSTYSVIASNAAALQIFQTGAYKEILPFAVTAFTIIILVLSVLEATKGREVAAERLERCAQEMSILNREFERRWAQIAPDAHTEQGELLAEVETRYREILLQCPDNHRREDLEYQKISSPSSDPVPVTMSVIRVHVMWRLARMLYLAAIIAPLGVALWLYSGAHIGS